MRETESRAEGRRNTRPQGQPPVRRESEPRAQGPRDSRPASRSPQSRNRMPASGTAEASAKQAERRRKDEIDFLDLDD